VLIIKVSESYFSSIVCRLQLPYLILYEVPDFYMTGYASNYLVYNMNYIRWTLLCISLETFSDCALEVVGRV
jgi:hypothetical protein